jgi:hypothetical protein
MRISLRILDIDTMTVMGLGDLRGTIDAVDGAPIPIEGITTAAEQKTVSE